MDKRMLVLCLVFVVVIVVIIVCDKMNNSKAEAMIAEAEVIITEAKAEANRMLKIGKGMLLREQGKMYKIYPDLHEYKIDTVLEGGSYITNFIIDNDGNIKVTMHNNTDRPIKPDIKIIFLDIYGFKTGDYSISWWFNEIKPGETRFDEGIVGFGWHNTPLYYRIY